MLSSLEKIRQARIKKLQELKEKNINSYPIYSKRTHTIKEVLLAFEELERKQENVALVGRIRAIREHGGLTFFNFEDDSGNFQAVLKKDILGEEKYNLFLNYFDIGDIVNVEGTLFVTKRGERSIKVSNFQILAKSLRPLPEKWHGLQDVEERFRKRYLDLIMNKEVKERFRKRSFIVKELRSFLDSKGFIEVETPILQPIPGGAYAQPFKTHLNALDIDLYLRIAPELYLKRLIVGGFEKIYEIGRCFRNEGMDKYHNPDFTMLELYWAYQDRDGLMSFVEELMLNLVRKVTGGNKLVYNKKEIDFTPPWPRVKYTEDYEETKQNIIQPTFIVDHPIKISFLAKAREDNPQIAHRFQLVVGGIELVNAYSELNDPLEQKDRLERADIEPQRIDKDFIEALEYGMPPTAGLGIGIDRLILLLCDAPNLRETILFPTMRPKEN